MILSNDDYRLLRAMHIEPGPRLDPGDLPARMSQRLAGVDCYEEIFRELWRWKRRAYQAWALSGVLGAAWVIWWAVAFLALAGWR